MSGDVRRSLRLPADLSDRIDRARGRESWSGWVKRMLEQALEPELAASAGLPREVYESPLLEAQFRDESQPAFIEPSSVARAVEVESGALEREAKAEPPRPAAGKVPSREEWLAMNGEQDG